MIIGHRRPGIHGEERSRACPPPAFPLTALQPLYVRRPRTTSTHKLPTLLAAFAILQRVRQARTPINTHIYLNSYQLSQSCEKGHACTIGNDFVFPECLLAFHCFTTRCLCGPLYTIISPTMRAFTLYRGRTYFFLGPFSL